jgi:hypothetical protein
VIRQIRNSILAKFLWGFMGLYLLNLSVDTQDPTPRFLPEDLSFNDQESLIEILLEQILGYENAVAEYDDSDTEEHSKQKDIKKDLFASYLVGSALNQPFTKMARQNFPHYRPYPTNGFQKLDTPPPRI